MKSSIDLDLHAGIEVVLVRLAVLTVEAIAFLPTFYTRPVALAVVLHAPRFLAGALPLRHKGRNSFKGARMAEVGHLTSTVDL